MIQHTVVFRFGGDTLAERAARADIAARHLRAMAGRIPGMSSLTITHDLRDDPTHWDLCLISLHDSRDALRAYIAHPRHLAAKAVIDSIVVSRAIVDSDLASAPIGREAP